jgi:hypothetical protein
MKISFGHCTVAIAQCNLHGGYCTVQFTLRTQVRQEIINWVNCLNILLLPILVKKI